MSPMTLCGPTIVELFVADWLIFLFPVAALVLQPLRRDAGPVGRALVGVITIFGVIMAPLAILMTAGTAAMALFD